MTWWAALPDALALALLVVVPGALALRLLGLRGLAAIAAAPPMTVAALGVLSVLLAVLDVAWRPPAVLTGLAVLLAALALVIRLLARRSTLGGAGSRWHPGPLGTGAVAVVVAAGIGGFLLLAAPFIGTLASVEAPLQQWDGVFHLNALVTVRETGVVTPFGGLAPLYGDGTLAPYYPTGWHAVLSLAPGSSVAAVTNIAILVLGIGVWMLGLVGLTREVFSHRTLPVVLAPLLAAGFVAYPAVQLTVLGQLAHGFSTALLPGVMLLTVRAVRAVQAGSGTSEITGAVVAAVVGAAGVAVAHGSGLFSVAPLAGPLVLGAVAGWALRLVRAGRRTAGGAVIVALVVSVLGAPVMLANLDLLSAVVNFERGSGRSHAGALREVLLDQTLTSSYAGDGWQHAVVTTATLAGAVLAFVRRRHRWVAVAFALSIGLTVLAAGPESHPLRWLAGFWYTQAARIAPGAVIPAVLLAAYSLSVLVAALRSRFAAPAVGRIVLAGVLAIAVVTAAVRFPLQERVVASAYVPGELAWETMATAQELDLMRRVGQRLPPDAVVVGDPFNGAALLPAVAGVAVVFPQLGASGMSPAQLVLQDRLGDIHTDPDVCSALAQVGATHLYQDTAGKRDGAKVNGRTAGMRHVDVSTGFMEVDSAGTAAVYRIDACGR